VDVFAQRAAALAEKHGPGFALGDSVIASLRQHEPKHD
jgi:hypothetical protein